MPDLDGRGVLITRPREQAGDLKAAIESANGVAFLYPALEISASEDAAVAAEFESKGTPDICLFVSPNAVRYGLEHVGPAMLGAIGPATAAAIESAGRTVDIRPTGGFDSEHLLMSDALADIDGKTIHIIRGQSGRELLGATLAHRGARVEYLSVYDRRRPEPDAATTKRLLDTWRDGRIHAWTIMSVETLENFLQLIGEPGIPFATGTPLVTPAARVINEASERLPGVFATLADGTSADELVDAVDSVMIYE